LPEAQCLLDRESGVWIIAQRVIREGGSERPVAFQFIIRIENARLELVRRKAMFLF
jgi:hypothetical protein